MRGWLCTLIALFLICGFLGHEKEQFAFSEIHLKVGEVSGSIVKEDGSPLITQLSFFDTEGDLIKRIQTDSEGGFDLFLEEGEYTLEISKGYEYEIKQLQINVECDKMLALNQVILPRLMDWTAKSYYSGDLHQHSQFSEAGEQTINEMIIANLANGLDFGALSDDQTVAGHDEWITLAQKFGYLAIPAQEVVTNEGHYLAINTTEIMDSSTLYSEEDIVNFIDEIHHQKGLVQINHPSQDFPFWKMASEFDVIEIWNGQAMPPIDDLPDKYAQWMINQEAKEKWFDLLSEGVKITALGNSDVYEVRSKMLKDSVSEEELFNDWVSQGLRVGSPRNYVKIDELSVAGILKGIKDGHVFITNGPLMDITLNDVTFGDELEAVSEVEMSYLIASNHQNLDCLNIIADGDVIESVALAEDAPTLGTLTLNLSDYHWVLFEVRTTSYEYAISNPIYLN